ncbi:hypothetical protein LAZ67_5003540 [Cordylochernes scorpioides]|uniref:HTH CENPB-type domain-containing protein n=1 Tax=Cordylochernes scorpioides TaxID=51811 RepID=A0ABY6KHA5_9ARAC|nr:hypothetical protein LAZ67_5003540 [Cordylochernes scorpioides]
MQFFSNVSSWNESGVAVYYDSFCLMQGCSICQSIIDSFQEKPTKKTTAVFLDMTSAFDRVWREKLLERLHNIGRSQDITDSPVTKSRQDSGRQGTSKQVDHCLYRKMEQGREENPKEPMESDPDSESGENTFPKKENTLGRTQEVPPGQEDVTPPPPVSDVLGRLTRTLHQLSAVTGLSRDVKLPRYDGSYEAQSFFTNYDAQADRAQLQYSTKLRKPPNLLQAPLRVTNTRARMIKIFEKTGYLEAKPRSERPSPLKLQILREIEVEKKKKTDVAQKHNIPQSSLSTIIKNSEKIHQQALHAGESSRKRARGSTYADVDEALLQWFKQARSAALPVNGPLLSEKAKTLALEFGLKDFTGSGGWIERWKARHGIHIPHPKEVLESIQTLRLFLQCQDESKSLHRHLSDLDNICDQAPMDDLKLLIINLSAEVNRLGEKMDARLLNIEQKMEVWERRMTGIETSMASCTDALATNTRLISHNTLKIRNLEERAEALERRARENNLIIYGIESAETDSRELLLQKVKKLMAEDMQITDDVVIAECHRLGRGPKAPILIEVPDHESRISLLKNSFKLRMLNIFMSRDYSPQIREQRKILIEKRKELYKKGIGSKLRDNKLLLNGINYMVVEGQYFLLAKIYKTSALAENIQSLHHQREPSSLHLLMLDHDVDHTRGTGHDNHASYTSPIDYHFSGKVFLEIKVEFNDLIPYSKGERMVETFCRMNESIQQKRADREGQIILLPDNARPHVAQVVKASLQELEWGVIQHPPYSPDLVPTDYHLFCSMSNHMRGTTFDDEDLKTWLNNFFDTRPDFWRKASTN